MTPYPKKPKNLAEEIGRNQPFESLDQELFLNLIRSSEWLQFEFAKVFQEYGITQPQFNVLKILEVEDKKGISIRKIGNRMTTRASDVTRLVDRLEKAGHVARQRTGADRRVILVRMTESGRKLVDNLREPLLEAHRRTKQHLSTEKLELLNSLLFELRQPAANRQAGNQLKKEK